MVFINLSMVEIHGNMLKTSEHIAKIIIDPENKITSMLLHKVLCGVQRSKRFYNLVMEVSLGIEYYTSQMILGFDVVMDQNDNDILYASTYQKDTLGY